MQDTAEVLFDYLRDILYQPDTACLKAEELPPEFRKLGEGLTFLADCVKESRTFSRAMARGDLSTEPPRVENVLAAPMKELQGSLRHLEWQTQQVAKGDYSQRVDFMGEFSDAFNTMISQLKEWREALLLEKQKLEQKNVELERNLELVIALTNFTHNMIFVYSLENHGPLFLNEPAQWFLKMRPKEAGGLQEKFRQRENQTPESAAGWELEIECGENAGQGTNSYFTVQSYPISWEKEAAIVHVVLDDTERRNKENLMYKLAYIDPLTGLNNRRYATDRMEGWMKEGTPFVMSFIDIDYLKYCNDTQGHKAGDHYLMETASALNSLGSEVCRIGGDEFIMMQKNTTAQEQDRRLEELRRALMESGTDSRYPKSFSFASCDVPKFPRSDLNEYIRITDSKMYQYKLAKKQPLKDLTYQDTRTV